MKKKSIQYYWCLKVSHCERSEAISRYPFQGISFKTIFVVYKKASCGRFFLNQKLVFNFHALSLLSGLVAFSVQKAEDRIALYNVFPAKAGIHFLIFGFPPSRERRSSKKLKIRYHPRFAPAIRVTCLPAGRSAYQKIILQSN